MENCQQQIVAIQCKNPECKEHFKCTLPRKAGVYKVVCPSCKSEINVRFRGANTTEGDPLISNKSDTGNNTIIECPWGCGTRFKYIPEKDGAHVVNCPNDNCINGMIDIVVKDGNVVFTGRHETRPIPISGNTSNGKLTIVRFKGLLGSIMNRSFTLHLGPNTIGRYDENLRSDIEIKNDTFVSRRSVVIEVIQNENGYLFKMTILNATNPVLHNSKPLIAGEIVYLNYGDSIQLGDTKFNFEKA